MVKLENDQEEIGYVPVIPKPLAPPSPKADIQEISQPYDRVYELFLKIAGNDEEVDWRELKDILDSSLSEELRASKQTASKFDASPGEQTTNSGNGLLTTILGLLCGTFCKDTPFADVIQAPTQDYPLQSFFDTSQKGFSKDVCRSMIAMLDEDRSGKLGFKEFKILWESVLNWKNVFFQYDKDQSGTFTGFELRDALKSAGYHLNNHILNTLMHRFGNKRGEINFEDFIMCAVRLKTTIDLFQRKSNNDTITFTMDEWMETAVYS